MAGEAEPADLSFSLARGGPLYSLLRRIRVVPAGGLAIRKRIILAWAFTLGPVILLALAPEQLWMRGGGAEPLLQHFDVWTRLLVAIPLLIAGDALLDFFLPRVGPQLRDTGLLAGADLPRFQRILRSGERLRDSRLAFAIALAVAAAAAASRVARIPPSRELSWAVTDGAGISLAGYWYAFAGYGLFMLLAVQWLWRLVVLTVVYRRIARLDLALVPTHPDGAGGLEFIQFTVFAFAPAAFALVAVISARWAYEMIYRGLRLDALAGSIVFLVVMITAALLTPLLMFTPSLVRLKGINRLRYSVLMARSGMAVDRKWVRGDAGNTEAPGAPELGPLIDILSLYRVVSAIRPLPLNVREFVILIVLVSLPLLPVLLLEVPLWEIFARVLKAI
jgi:hypothetical protein